MYTSNEWQKKNKNDRSSKDNKKENKHSKGGVREEIRQKRQNKLRTRYYEDLS